MFHVHLAANAISTFRHSLPLLLCALWFSTEPVNGTPIIAKVLTYNDAAMVASATPSSLPFDFRIYDPKFEPTLVYVSWLQNYTPADVGQSFFAPPDVVAGATSARSSTSALSVLEVNRGGFHSDSQPWWLGFPNDHYISAIERIVDKFEITTLTQTRYNVQFAHRVRIWVEPIPEPPAIAITAIAVSIVGVFQFRASGRRRRTLRCSRCPSSVGS